uniref:Pleckstrin-like protein domain-containing family A member 6 n=1 Tax=Magallana gigas TaxID=29159 RepID=K1RAF6_MAGGI
MRKKSSKVGKDETKTNHMVSGSCQTEAEPTIGRPVEVVSDIFHFLTETEGELNGNGRESGIPRPGNEDKIFNKLLIIDETQEKHKEQSGNSSVGHFNGCITDGVCNTDGPNIESDRNSPKPQGNVTDHSMENSEDSSDDDTGIYNESYRKSVWLCMPDEKSPNLLQSSSIAEEEPESDEVFIRGIETKLLEKSHKRTDSTTTTCSESEFKHEYRLRRKCMVHRHDSQQEYQRMSAKVYEHEQLVVIYKDGKDRDFGLHIFDSHPAFITEVDHGSPAQRAGLKAGQVLLSVNGVNVLELSHQEIIKLVQKDSNIVKLEVASSDVHYVRNQQTPVMSGYMYKQSNSTFVKNWRRRYFVLRFDNCLYYYKGEQDQDPLGAIPLLNYIVSKQTDSSREHYFKAEKFGARTYYFIADSRVEMIKWVSSLNEAATRAKEKKDAWMDVTASNVGLPALDIKKPDCFGYLSKCGRTVRTWRKRYCVLKDACIYYYKNINSSSAQGMAHLHGYKVENMTSSLRKHGFVLRPPEPQMRTFSFCAENETHKERWMAALEKSIQRWIKVD